MHEQLPVVLSVSQSTQIEVIFSKACFSIPCCRLGCVISHRTQDFVTFHNSACGLSHCLLQSTVLIGRSAVFGFITDFSH